MSRNVTEQVELIPGSERDHALSQFFTPPKLAAKLVEWAGVVEFVEDGGTRYKRGREGGHTRPFRVLEPSAGNGAIVRELVAAGAHVHAVELDLRYVGDLANALGLGKPEHRMECPADFIDWEYWGPRFDLVCGNFPFHLDLDGAFTLHALKFAPRACAIYPSNVFYSAKREAFWKQVRPTRIAYMSKRAWPGATDYVALELVDRERCWQPDHVTVEWWVESWS